MKLIVAIGNPTKKYESTRHNAGVIVLNSFLSKIFQLIPWKTEKKFLGDVVELNFTHLTKLKSLNIKLFNEIDKIFINGDDKVLCVFPTTYMNNSGESVSAIVNFYKLKTTDVLVIHDDLDIVLGEYKLQFAKGPKVHNGIISIEKYLKRDFFRLRIGIEARAQKLEGMDYVLENFTTTELQTLNSLTNEE